MGKNYGNFVIRGTSRTQMYTSQRTHTEISEVRREKEYFRKDYQESRNMSVQTDFPFHFFRGKLF